MRLQLAEEKRTPVEALRMEEHLAGRLAYDQGRFELALLAFGKALTVATNHNLELRAAETVFVAARMFFDMEEYERSAVFLGLSVGIHRRYKTAPDDETLEAAGSLARRLRSTIGSIRFDDLFARGTESTLSSAADGVQQARVERSRYLG